MCCCWCARSSASSLCASIAPAIPRVSRRFSRRTARTCSSRAISTASRPSTGSPSTGSSKRLKTHRLQRSASRISERETQDKIALILVGAEQRRHWVAEILGAPARVAEFWRDPHDSQLQFEACAEREPDIGVFVELRGRIYGNVQSRDSAPDLVDSRNVAEVRARVDEGAEGTSEERVLAQNRKFPGVRGSARGCGAAGTGKLIVIVAQALIQRVDLDGEAERKI